MKRLTVLACALCTMCLSFCLAACGSSFAKVTGIMAGIGTEQNHPLAYGNPLRNGQTLIEDDYILQVGQSYLLSVTYTQSGGSRVCGIYADQITLRYDAEALEIAPPDEKEGMSIDYRLTCKKSVAYTAVLVEVGGEYSCILIITAE